MENEQIKKKRGRKKKIPDNITFETAQNLASNATNDNIKLETNTDTNDNTKLETNTDTTKIPKIPKKRGRKPKGGKIINNIQIKTTEPILPQNIILHLKCSMSDITNVTFNNICEYNPNNITSIVPFNYNADINYEVIHDNEEISPINDPLKYELEMNDKIKDNIIDIKPVNLGIHFNENSKTSKNPVVDVDDNKMLWNKLKNLTSNLHYNNIEKKSNCFWCTEPFDIPSIFIPKCKMNEKYEVYGCFCSPECAAAHLFNERLDNSTKFERYHLLNNIYGAIYDYKSNIKPAPAPFYLLDKYYGELTIEEYRNLLKTDKIVMMVEKPMTRVFPELFEENNEYPIQNLHHTAVADSVYRLSRKNTVNKKSFYLTENFGI